MFILSFSVSAQCGGGKPTWARSDFYKDLERTYLEVVVEDGRSREEARDKAQAEIERRRKITVGTNDPWIKAQPIAEYPECGSGTFYFLYQTRRNPDPKYIPEKVVSTNDYPLSDVGLRFLVPGMVQIHKGSTTKGLLFIVGEVACIGGIVACEGLRTSYQSKINTTYNAQDKQNYINNADDMQNLRNGFIAGTTLLYVWNVIDGIVAKGKPHITIQENKHLSIVPYIAPQLEGSITGGISLSFNF